MKKDIYKITNTINNKVYIGQSKDSRKRFKQHASLCATERSKISLAIAKYGVENFTFEIIEHDIENYNEREKYWIKYYKSNEREFGYNITEGGEEPPIISGDNSYFAIYSEDTIDKVKERIVNTKDSFSKIAEEYNLSETYLSFLNRGIIRKDNKHLYPLRKHGNEMNIEAAANVADKLENTFLSFEQIAKECNVSISFVYDINKGLQQYCPKQYLYPIRETNARASQKGFNKLIKMLQDNKYKRNEIAHILKVSPVFVSRFNNGKIYKQNNINYPIRKSSQRVY